jgi:hypothetical protein
MEEKKIIIKTQNEEEKLFFAFLDACLDYLRGVFYNPSIINYHICNCIIDTNKMRNMNKNYEIVKEVMSILYPYKDSINKRNDSVFSINTPIFMLPGIDFKLIWSSGIDENCKNKIWKYMKNIFKTGLAICKNINFDVKDIVSQRYIKNKNKNKNQSSQQSQQSQQPQLQNLTQMLGPMMGMMGSMEDISEEDKDNMSYMMEVSKIMMDDMGDKNNIMDLLQNLMNPTKMQEIYKKMEKKIENGELDKEKLNKVAGIMHGKIGNNPIFGMMQSQLEQSITDNRGDSDGMNMGMNMDMGMGIGMGMDMNNPIFKMMIQNQNNKK